MKRLAATLVAAFSGFFCSLPAWPEGSLPAQWRLVPPYGGRASVMAAAPSEPARLYLGTESNGLAWSADSGEGWTPARRSATNLPIRRLVVDPQAPGVVFASAASGSSDGVLRSVDGGAHWAPVNNGLGENPTALVNELVFDPHDPRTLLAATDRGLFRTRNAGDFWKPVGLQGLYVAALAADPRHPGTLFADVWNGDVPSLRKSLDGGATWQPADQGIQPSGAGSRPSRPFFTFLFFDPRDPASLYAGGNGWPTYRSGDGGRTWKNLDEAVLGLASPAPGVLLAIPYYYPSRPVPGLLRSDDRGESWSPAGDLPDAVNALLAPPRSGLRLYAAAESGVWISQDGGASWRPHSRGFAARRVSDLAVRGADLYLTAAEGARISIDGGRRWRALRGPSVLAVFDRFLAAEDASAVLYAFSTATGQVYRSPDGGTTWSAIPWPAYSPTVNPTYGLSGNFSTLASDPRHPGTLYAGFFYANGLDSPRCHLVSTTDLGAHWTCLAVELSADTLQVDPRTSTLWIDGRYRARFGATRIETGDAGLPRDAASFLTFDAFTGEIYAAVGRRVFSSSDEGTTWREAGRLPRGERVSALLADPVRPGTFYAGTEAGHVYRSLDDARSWLPLADGLPDGSPIDELALDAATAPTLYAVADGRGLYALDLAAP